MFDVISFLEEHDIEHKSSGKNISSGWVGLNCVFPNCSDRSFHLGWNIKSGLYKCWICGAKGGAEKLVQKLLGIPFSKARKIVEQFDTNYVEEEEAVSAVEEVVYPRGVEKVFPQAHKNYLIGRGFDPTIVIPKYKLCAYHHLGGEFAYRVVAPVIINGRVVSLIGRDVTGQQEKRYHFLPVEKSIIPPRDCLYGIDFVKDKVVIVEGLFDAWRIGDGCVATLGTEFTSKQLNLLYKKKIKEAYVMFDSVIKDPSAPKKAQKLGYMLSTFVPKIEVLELDKGDPADLKEEEVKKFRGELGFI